MTDDESRKAFDDWFFRSDCQSAEAAWIASGEYHTKRERDRCRKIIQAALDAAMADLRILQSDLGVMLDLDEVEL